MRIAALDLGTNSFLCLIADVVRTESDSYKSPDISVLSDSCRVVRLGERVNETKKFSTAALTRAKNALSEFSNVLKEAKPEKIIATATSAARDVTNGEELLKICQDLSIPLHIIEGEKEAELSFLGAVSAIPRWQEQKILVVDVGGGSTELIYKEPSQKQNAKSFDVGCVRLTEMFIHSDPIQKKEVLELESFVQNKIRTYGKMKPDKIIAVAGTPTTLACVSEKTHFDEEKVEGMKLSLKKIEKLKWHLASIPLAKRKLIKGLDPLRADVIVAGASILGVTLKQMEARSLTVSTRGLRYGVALNHGDFL